MVQAGVEMSATTGANSSNMANSGQPPQQEIPQPDARLIGREFVRQYYTMLAEHPKYVHRFYSHDSIFIHGDSDSIVGQSAIQKKIQELCYDQCQAKIKKVDSCEAPAKGVVIQVLGELSCHGNPGRRFHQTFVLAPQSSKKYYVFNDIFQYAEEVFIPEDRASSVPAIDGNFPVVPDASMQEPRETILNGSVTHEELRGGGDQVVQGTNFALSQTQAPLPQRRRQDSNMSAQGSRDQSESVGGGPAETTQHHRERTSSAHSGFQMEGSVPPPPVVPDPIRPESESVAAPPPVQGSIQPTEPQEEVPLGPRSWAQLVTGGTGPVNVGVVQASPQPQSQPVQEASDVNQSNKQAVAGNHREHPPVHLPMPQFKGSRELFVGNLPPEVQQEALHEFFGKYGKVMSVRIPTLKPQLDFNGRQKQPIAFISFENSSSVREILEKAWSGTKEYLAINPAPTSVRPGKLQMLFRNDWSINVEEKKDRDEERGRQGGYQHFGGDFKSQGGQWSGGGPRRGPPTGGGRGRGGGGRGGGGDRGGGGMRTGGPRGGGGGGNR